MNKALVGIPPPPPRFTFEEWQLQNQLRQRCINDQQHLSERIKAESERIVLLTDDATKLNKAETDRKLQERILDVEFRLKELENQRGEGCKEEEALLAYRERIFGALDSIKERGLVVSRKCILLREGRLGIDLVDDDADRELVKEVEITEGVQVLLLRTLDQITEQLRSLRSTKYFIDRDIEDKSNLLKIDNYCLGLNEHSSELSIYHGFSPLDAGQVSQEEWEIHSTRNLGKAVQEVHSARLLRTYIDTLLTQVTEDLRKQFHATNHAFRYTIQETRRAKVKLEEEHLETVKKINDMRKNITRLEVALGQKECFMALAHTRLGHRAQRSTVELCRDEAESNLVGECIAIQENVGRLQQLLAESQASMRYLLATQLQLEEDINVKTNTLKIDEIDCMGMRSGMDYHAY